MTWRSNRVCNSCTDISKLSYNSYHLFVTKTKENDRPFNSEFCLKTQKDPFLLFCLLGATVYKIGLNRILSQQGKDVQSTKLDAIFLDWSAAKTDPSTFFWFILLLTSKLELQLDFPHNKWINYTNSALLALSAICLPFTTNICLILTVWTSWSNT